MTRKDWPLALKQLDLVVRQQHHHALRSYILRRHSEDPNLTIDALAAEHNVPRETWRRWLKRYLRIGIGDGPRLIDLDHGDQQAALSEAARIIDEAEADEAHANAA